MKKYNYALLSDEVDVTEISGSKVQDEGCNREYLLWRKRDNNIFAFSGKRSGRLHTYVDGIGISESTPETREAAALKNICFLVTVCVLIYALVENVLVLPLLLLFKLFGIEVSYSFHESIAYGNQYAVLVVLIFESVLKLLLPLLLMRCRLKMPKRAAEPIKVGNVHSMVSAMCMACICFFVVGLLRCIAPMEIFSVNNIGMTYQVISYMNTGCSAVYLIVELLLVPMLMEIFYHGALFQALRQFGAGFAVMFTAILNTIVMHDPASFAMLFVTSLAAGIGVWKSGSLITGILVNMEMRFFGFILFRCEELPNLGDIPAVYVCVFAVLALGLLGVLGLRFFENRSTVFDDYQTFLSIKEKVRLSIWGSSMIAVWVLCAVLMLIEIFM